jgi:glycosyltransferase involved in cell wall biosynthesis
MKSILIFSPNNCFPPLHGSHHRCIQQFDDLNKTYNLYIASSRDSSDTPWPVEKKDYNYIGKQYGIKNIFLFEDSLVGKIDYIVGRIIWIIYCRTNINFFKYLRFVIQKLILASWFGSLTISLKPISVVIHHTKWGFLGRLASTPLKIIELPDILPVQRYLFAEISKVLSDGFSDCKPINLPWPCFIDSTDQLPGDVATQIIDDVNTISQFDLAWLISEREQMLLVNSGMSIESCIIYPSIQVETRSKEKSSSPILPLGPNAFNVYSLYRFIQDVLPIIDSNVLNSAEILVSGSLGSHAKSVELKPPFHHVGFVDNFLELLASSCLMLAPTAMGTGQQVKIFESLAVGTPVLAYKSAVPKDVLAQNPCIMAANNEEEFARYLSDFITNKDLREKYADLAAQSAIKQAELIKSRPYSVSLERALARLGH